MNKKQTYLLTTASAVIGLTVGVGTAGYRYFKNEENREKFLTNPTVQKLRDNTNTLFEQVRNGQLKLTNSKNQTEQDSNEISQSTKAEAVAVENTVSNEEKNTTTNAQKDQSVKNETQTAPQAQTTTQSTPSAKSTQTQNSNKNNAKPSQEAPKNNVNKNVAKN